MGVYVWEFLFIFFWENESFEENENFEIVIEGKKRELIDIYYIMVIYY